MNSCQQDQWKKVTGLFHYAASLRLVQDPKLYRLTLPGSWRALPLGKLVNFNWKTKEDWLGMGTQPPFLTKSQEVLKCMGQSYPIVNCEDKTTLMKVSL